MVLYTHEGLSGNVFCIDYNVCLTRREKISGIGCHTGILCKAVYAIIVECFLEITCSKRNLILNKNRQVDPYLYLLYVR